MTHSDDIGSAPGPREFWDAKAARSGGDAWRAACQDDPQSNRLIARVQYHEMTTALHWLRRDLPFEGAALLDFGCGPGRWVDFFEARGFAYRGADISPRMLAMARACHPGVEFDLLEDDRLPYADAAFDLVCSIAVIHHNPYPRQDRLLSEIARVIRPGGHALLFEGLGEASTPGIHHPRPLESWATAMRDRGLSLERHEGTRYGVLRIVTLRALHAVPVEAARHAAWQRSPRKPWWQRAVDGLDGTVTPGLAPLLPPRTHRRGLLLFRKTPRG